MLGFDEVVGKPARPIMCGISTYCGMRNGIDIGMDWYNQYGNPIP